MNREKYDGDWMKFLVERKFTEVITVATAMREKGSLTEDEIASLLEPEEHCPTQSKVDYILNVMMSLRLTDSSLAWKGN